MSLDTVIQSLATRIGTEAKSLRTLINGNVADLTGLTTTVKTSLVAAINELKSSITAMGSPAQINDSATNTGSVWSSSKTNTEIGVAVSAVVASSPAALDTLNELAAALGNDANFAATTATALGNRVRFDAVQTLTAPQKAQAIANIGAISATDIGSTTTDYVAIFNAALV